MLFGDRLKMLREDKDITQKELGVSVGVSDRVIGYYESNDRFPKDENILKAFADYFNVSVDYLVGRTDIKNHESKVEFNPKLTKKDERDIEKILDNTLESLEKQEGLMLQGDLVDEEDFELLKMAIRNGLEYAKLSNKKKYTPKKYRK